MTYNSASLDSLQYNPQLKFVIGRMMWKIWFCRGLNYVGDLISNEHMITF